MKRKLPTAVQIALTLAFPVLAQAAPSDAEVKAMEQRIMSLESRLDQMQKMLDARPAAASSAATAPSAAPAAEDHAELAELKQKVAKQAMKVDKMYTDNYDSAGAGLEVTGYIDPTYVFNANMKTSSFHFMNSYDPSYDEPLSYDSSSNGNVFLRMVKTFGEGAMAPKVELVIAPARGDGAYLVNSNGAPNSSIFHTALATIPIADGLAITGGLTNGYGGYEYTESTLTNTVSHNLLFDFSAPGSLVGVGFTYNTPSWDWAVKGFIGNEEYHTTGSRADIHSPNTTPTISFRADYTASTALFIGGSFNLGRNSNTPCGGGTYGYQCSGTNPYSDKAYAELDMTYQSADTTYNAEIDYGTQSEAAWNGGTAEWWGVSGTAHHKWSMGALGRVGATVRVDYLNNQRNGGGGGGTYLYDATTPLLDANDPSGLTKLQGTDSINGFGVAPECIVADNTVNFGYGLSCEGANRVALTMAFLVYPTDKWTLKAEYRRDWADKPVFRKFGDDTYTQTNDVVSLQMVYGF